MTAELNKIYVNSSLTVENGYSNTLCFIDGKATSKNRYALENNELTIQKEAKDYISVFYNTNSSSTYYFDKILNDYGVKIAGKDISGKKLTGLRSDNVLVFVDGVLLNKSEYNIVDTETITLFTMKNDQIFHNVIVYVSNNSLAYGVLEDPTNSKNKDNVLNPNNPNNAIGYSRNTTLMFVNGRFLSPNKIDTINGYTFVTYTPAASDKFEYYKLNSNTISVNFEATKGITTYGPIDDYNQKMPNLYDSNVAFDDLVKVVIDDLRPGFVICEKNRPGRLLVADTNYETNRIKTITLQAFSNNVYTKDEYYLEVPEAKSIVDYLSDYDKSHDIFPEILRIFQRSLLDEIHDEIERIKNIRNIRKVNSDHIYKLLSFLGMNLDIKHLNIKQMQEALDELTEFYRIAGTKQSLNYFNIVQDNTKLINIKQLYTFHKQRKKKEENKIYSYSYGVYKQGQIVYGGTGYVPGEKYKVLNADASDSNIVIEIKETGPNGSIIDGGFTANMHEGKIPYSTLPLDITTNSVGALLDCSSTPAKYIYDCEVTSDNPSLFRAGDVLSTPKFPGKITIDSIVDNKINAHLEVTTGKDSYSNVINTPLQLEENKTDLKLSITARNESSTEVYRHNGKGTVSYSVDETAIYRVTISGAGGSGGASDTGYGNTADSPASKGYAGEKKIVYIPCSKGTKLTFDIGEGGRKSYARGDGSSLQCGVGGWGGTAEATGKMGDGKGDNMMGTRRHDWRGRTKYYCCALQTADGNVIHYHGGHWIASKAAAGAGGGGTRVIYNGVEWGRAAGGNGGNATWANNLHEGESKTQSGGVGGYGGTTTGNGARGGRRNQDDNTFWSENGEDGYVIVEKVIQRYDENAQLVNNKNIRLQDGTELKTTDDMFTIIAHRIENEKIVNFEVLPKRGVKPIYNINDAGNGIASYSKTFDVVCSANLTAYLTIKQTVDIYKYNLVVKNSNGVYKANQTLTDENNIFTLTTVDVPDGTIEKFEQNPEFGTQNINFQNSVLTTAQGSGAKIVVTSSADVETQNIEREYVDFYLPEEQGAEWKKEYRYPFIDYGYVNQGSPNSPAPWSPGTPDIDYGLVTEGTPNSPFPDRIESVHTKTIIDSAVPEYNITKTITELGPIGNPDIDYGLVSEKIKGQWVEWLEWDRPADLYPTNHVEVEVNILSVEDYDKAMARFYKQFYSLASTVLYIHRLITVYNFGNNTTANITADEQDTSGSMILMGFMTTQPFDEEIYTITSDPARQNCFRQEI